MSVRLALIWALWIAAALGIQTVSADTLRGKVVGVSDGDGDTLTVLDEQHHPHKIRLAGIDAPEKAQSFGQQSKQHLSDLVFKANVSVEHHKVDRYGHTIGKVMLNGQYVNIQQIAAGLAWHYKAYEKEQSIADRLSYASAENLARKNSLGLWRDTEHIAPWDWRKHAALKH